MLLGQLFQVLLDWELWKKHRLKLAIVCCFVRAISCSKKGALSNNSAVLNEVQ